MSASQTPPGPPGGDPSMEDILASIRRILSEDEAPAAAEQSARRRNRLATACWCSIPP